MDASLVDVWPAAAALYGAVTVNELVLLAPWTRCYLRSPQRGRGASSMYDSAQAERDERLIAAIASGDRDALGELYDRFSPSLLAVALRMLGSSREAEDVVQDVFLEAWQRARHYDRARGTVRTWLMLRLRSRTLDRIRSSRRARGISFEELAGSTRATASALLPASEGNTEAALASLDGDVLRAALAELPEDQRRVLELGYFSGQSCAEIAAVLSVPIGTVKSRMSRAIAHLRARLVPEEDAS
jgi:RNA polymerase sigma-70 factor (ECF subfamily)